MEKIIAAMKKAHNLELIKQTHVHQLWEDGELTIQKAGELLGQRNLHCLSFPLLESGGEKAKTIAFALSGGTGHASIYCTEEDAHTIRAMMKETF